MFCLPLNPGKIGFYNFFFQGTMRVIEEYTLAKWLLEFLGIPRIFLGIKV